MKQLLGLALLVGVANTYAADTVKSKTIKKKICSEVESDLEYDHDIKTFDYKKCMAGQFDASNIVYSQEYSTVTLMDVNFEFKYEKYEISGFSQAYRTFTVNSDGNLKKSWGTRATYIKLKDNRDLITILDTLFDNDSIDVHNGDYGYTKVDSSKVTEAQIVKNLEESLENWGNPDTDSEYDFCQYETTTNKKYTIEGLDQHSDDAYELIKKLDKEGKILHAISRDFVDGASEYCSHYYYEILTSEGVQIYFYFDFTT